MRVVGWVGFVPGVAGGRARQASDRRARDHGRGARVGEILTASTADVEDADRPNGATFAVQPVPSDGPAGGQPSLQSERQRETRRDSVCMP